MKHIFILHADGFFSFFLRVIDWLAVIHYNDAFERYKLYVCMHYNKTDIPEDIYPLGNLLLHPDDQSVDNLWDYFFEPVNKYESTHTISSNDIVWSKDFPGTHFSKDHAASRGAVYINDLNDHVHFMTEFPRNYFWCDPHVYKHDDFQKLRNHYNKIIQLYIQPKKIVVDQMDNIVHHKRKHKWLGIHVRVPAHHYNTTQNQKDIDDYYTHIIESIKPTIMEINPDKIFLATESMEMVELMTTLYPDKIFYYDIPRVRGNMDWTLRSKKSYHVNYEKETYHILMDFLTLTKCDFILGATSNFFMCTLLYNAEIDFRLIPYLQNHRGD